MTKYLIKKFVKNYENISNPIVRNSYIILSSIVGILINAILFAMKLSVGMISGSIAITADAFNNLFDAASSVIGLLGIKLSMRPPDKEHPFGHGRLEYIAALIVSITVIQFSINFFRDSISRIQHAPALHASLFMFIFLGISIILKLFLASMNRYIGKKTNSDIALAVSADCISDIFVTLATIIPLLISYFTSIRIDGYIGLLVSVIVFKTGVEIAKSTLDSLIGKPISSEEYDEIKGLVESYEGILGTHDLIVHSYGENYKMATIHCEVASDVDIIKTHELIDKIEHDISRELGLFLVIHMDPIDVNDPKLLFLKNKIQELISEIDNKLNIHDFRMVSGDNHINIIFDMVVPFTYSEDEENELLKKCIDKIHDYNSKIECIITLDRSYIDSSK